MRAVFGSMRLTRDIDFDRTPSLSNSSLRGGLVSTLTVAAANAGISQPAAEITKSSDTTVRARLTGRGPGADQLRFEVEVSGRRVPDVRYLRRETVIPPATYGMAPFLIESYTGNMLAAQKIGAAMSAARNAPRDIYDLFDLMTAGVDPAPSLTEQPASKIAALRGGVLAKLDLVTFNHAREELLPYLPPATRETIDAERWMEYVLHVAEAIERWVEAALDQQRPAPAGKPRPAPKKSRR